jgi:CspA family cold shock protein
MNRERGTVKWFSREKGWGFLRRENGEEIFVHHSDIEGEGHVTLVDEEEVEFGVEDMDKGPRAREVRRPGQAPAASAASQAARSQAPAESSRSGGSGQREQPSRSRAGKPAAPAAAAASRGQDRAPREEPRDSGSAAPSRDEGHGGGPPPLDRGLRERLRDRFPIFRDR